MTTDHPSEDLEPRDARSAEPEEERAVDGATPGADAESVDDAVGVAEDVQADGDPAGAEQPSPGGAPAEDASPARDELVPVPPAVGRVLVEEPEHPPLRLKRLEIEGFKSFATRVDFEFEPGITGVVGPNGCGKSNIVDALKWVLGEQRASSVRGSEMQDIIFKGARSREAAHRAEVTLWLEEVLEDPEEARPAEALVLGRRLDRDGNSAYLLNNQVVRLKDVRSQLFDTGLGVRAYSVLEQGRIDAVLETNPVNRRAIFEEAAGISRFRIQRREALSKLERTTVNLEKAEERLGEQARRIQSLKRQASRARRYQEVSERLKVLRVETGLARLHQVSGVLERAGGHLEREEAQVARLRRERSTREEEVRVFDRQVVRCSEDLEEKRREQSHREAELRSIDEQNELLRQSIRQEEARGEDLDRRRERLREELAAKERSRGEYEGKLQAFQEVEERTHGELERVETRYQEERRVFEAARREVGQLDEARLEAVQARTAASNRVHELNGRKVSAEQRFQLLDGRRRAKAQEGEAFVVEVAGLGEREREVEGRLETILAEVEGLSDRRVQAEEALAGIQARRLELSTQRASHEAKVEALEALERELEGFGAGTKALLAREDVRGLRGLVVDGLHAESEVARAVEVALGDALTALVVQDLERAREAIALLHEERLGRAVFVLADGLGGPAPTVPEGGSSPAGRPGVLGPLADRVRFEMEWRDAARALLADCWLVDGTADLEALLRAFPAQRFATVDGQLFTGGWPPRITGGFFAEGAGIVPRKSAIAELRERIEVFEQELADTEERRQTIAAELESVEGRRAELIRDEREHQRRLEGLRSDRVRAETRLGRHREELEQLAHDLTELQEHLDDFAAQLADAQRQLAEREEALEALRRLEEEKYEQLEDARQRSDEAQREEHRIRIRLKELHGERRAVDEGVAALTRAIEDVELAIEQVAQERERSRENVAHHQKQIAELEARQREIVERNRTSDAEIEAARERLDRTRHQTERRRRRLERIQVDLEKRLERIQAARLRLQDAEHRRQELVVRMEEDYHVDLAELLAEARRTESVPDFGVEELKEREDEIQNLRKALEGIGGVNLEAIQELEEIEGEHLELKANCEDLRQGMARLQETIQHLDLQSRERFLETFEEVRKNFEHLFKRLFNGGQAELELTGEAEDPLEKGIEIRARPAGKSLQKVTLLSGGERTMTALAILFAIFQTKPSPFCLLDEVDAALDDANVARFLAMLDEFTADTQFVIVTHNKATMARCDVLYGVTMQEPGVSSRVSVRWEEVSEEGELSAAAKRRASAERREQERTEVEVGAD